jgi:hypothetical protein
MHRGQVYGQRAIAQRFSGNIVTATTHTHRNIVVPRIIDGGYDIGGTGATSDCRRVFVDHAVPELSCRIVR